MRVPITSIRENPSNPRKLDRAKFEKLVQSIRDFPEMLDKRPIIVANGIILGGNMRHKAAIQAGMNEIPIIDASDWTEEQRQQFIIKDNVSFGEWDWDLLANEWDAAELEEWGLDVWQPDAEPTEGLTDPDDVPEVPEEPVTRLGDLYILGEHRLLCGDSTKAEDVERLMDGQKADLCFTSPPYALGKSASLSGNKGNRTRGNAYESHDDNAQDWAALMSGFHHELGPYVQAFCVNVQPLAGNKRELFAWIADNAETLVDVAVWAKDNAAPQMAKNVLTSQYELLVFLGERNASRAVPFADFQGNRSALYQGGANRENKAASIHGAAMPSHLPKWVLGEVCVQAKTIVDPFCGTGTTVIVCEELNRKCYGMELDPKYCDVIVKRWEDFTGKKAELVRE